MRNALAVRFELGLLPDAIVGKLVEGFSKSDCAIAVALVESLNRERARRTNHEAAPIEIELPLVAPVEIFEAQAGLLWSGAAMLELARTEENNLEKPNGFQLAAELVVEVIHALDRQARQFSAVTNTVN